MDAFLGNLQEAIFTMNTETTQVFMVHLHSFYRCISMKPGCLTLRSSLNRWKCYFVRRRLVCLPSLRIDATFVGQVSVLSLIAIFGAATTAMVTTARKAVTLLLSFVIFTKPLMEQHGSGLILIAMGITLKLLPDSKLPSRAAVFDASDMQKPLENKDREDEEKKPLF